MNAAGLLSTAGSLLFLLFALTEESRPFLLTLIAYLDPNPQTLLDTLSLILTPTLGQGGRLITLTLQDIHIPSLQEGQDPGPLITGKTLAPDHITTTVGQSEKW